MNAPVRIELKTKLMSVNMLYSFNSKTKRCYMNKRGKDCKANILEELENVQTPMFNEEIEVKVQLKFKDNRKKLDLDNYMKLLLDSMSGVIYRDDSLIYKLTITKEIGCKCGNLAIIDIKPLEMFVDSDPEDVPDAVAPISKRKVAIRRKV